MSQSILEIIFKTVNQGQGGKAAANELKELKGAVGEASQGMLGLNLGSLTVVGALTAAGAAAAKAVGDYTAYAEKIRGMATITGTGTEETSRLVQAFDDLGVSQETLSSVMETASRKGFVATIENVSALADKYNALTDQQEKNKLLTDTLGKSGLDLAKAFQQGGQAIKDAAAAQATGMLITAKDAEEAEKLRVAQDNLDDSIQAVSNSFAKVMVPVLTEIINSSMHATVTTQNMATELAKIPPQQRAGAVAAAEYNARLASNEQVTTNVTNAYTRMAQIANKEAAPAIEYMGRAASTATPAFDLTADAQRNLMSGVQYSTQAFLDQKGAMEGLESATRRLQDAQKEWGARVGGDVKSALDKAYISSDNYAKGLDVIDKATGSNFAQQKAYTDNIKKAVDAFARSGDAEAFGRAIDGTKTAFEQMDAQVVAAQKEVTDLQLRLDTLVSKTYIIGIQTVTGTSGTSGKTQAPKGIVNGPADYGYATGTDFIIPPGWNENFPIGPNGGASSGERVTVTPAGQTMNMGGVTIIVNGAGDPNAVANAISLRLASYGKQYQGG